MSEWINCEERLPELLQKVLFHCVLDDSISNTYMGYLSNEGWNIYLPYMSFKLINDKELVKVTHWMELPPLTYDCSTKDSEMTENYLE